jgi:hypothetical protein
MVRHDVLIFHRRVYNHQVLGERNYYLRHEGDIYGLDLPSMPSENLD